MLGTDKKVLGFYNTLFAFIPQIFILHVVNGLIANVRLIWILYSRLGKEAVIKILNVYLVTFVWIW